MTARLPHKAYHHRKIRQARSPATRLSAAYDYLRAVSRGAPEHLDYLVRRHLAPLAEAMAEAADDLAAELKKKEGGEGK